MVKRALVFRLADWPLAEKLREAYGLDADKWGAAAMYFAGSSPGELALPEEASTEEETSRVGQVIFQLAQSFLRDPEVREGFYEGGSRGLSFAHFAGVEPDALTKALRDAELDVWSIAELLERRAAQEPATLASLDDLEGEGVVDRFAAYRATHEAAWAELLAEPGHFGGGLSSKAAHVLARLDDPAAFEGHVTSELVAALCSLATGRAKHPFIVGRVIRLLASEPFAAVASGEVEVPRWSSELLELAPPDTPEAALASLRRALDARDAPKAPPPEPDAPVESDRERWLRLAARHRDGDRSVAGELGALTETLMPACADELPELWDYVPLGIALDADVVWRGALAILAAEGGEAMRDALAEVAGAHPLPAPRDADLAARVTQALEGAPAHVADALRPRAGGGVRGRLVVDGGLVAVLGGDLLRGQPPASDDAWRDAHQRNDAAVFATRGDGVFDFVLEPGAPPEGPDVVTWPVVFQGGGALCSGAAAAPLGPLEGMHEVSLALGDEGSTLRIWLQPEPTRPPTDGYPIPLPSGAS